MPEVLPENLRSEFASVKRDPYRPQYWGDRLDPSDETLIHRGKGYARTYDVYADILRDCHAYAILQKRYMEIVGREWEVVPGGKDKADEKAADLCRDILTNLSSHSMQREDSDETEISISGGFDQTCLDLLPAILNGISASEIIWDKQGQEVRPTEIIQRDIRRFVFRMGDRGYCLRLLTNDDLHSGEPIPSRKMILHRFSSMGMSSDPYGFGLGTRLFYPTYFKRNAVKFWLIFADKHGSPTAVIHHPKNATAVDKQTYKTALKAIAQDSGIMLPEGVVVDFLEASRSSTINCYEGLVDFCNEEMSKSVLGETGSTDQSGAGGSRARDEVGNTIRIAIAKSDADLLSDTLNRTLLTWITRLNYGDSVKPPKVWRKFPELEEKEDLNSRIGRDKQLFDLGFRITKDKVLQTYGEGYETSEGEDQKPPLVTRLGVSGTASFMQFLGQIGSGSIPRENAVAALAIVFGMSAEEANKIVPKEEAIAEAQKSNPETAPDLAGMLGGGDQSAPATPPAATATAAAPTDQPPPVALAETVNEAPDPAELFTEKVRKSAQKTVGDWVSQIGAIVEATESFEEIQSKLSELYPDLKPGEFSGAIASAMAASHLAGRWEVLQEGSEANLSETAADTLDYKTASKSTRKAPNCTPGKSFSCGFSCQAMGKKCRSQVSKQADQYANYLEGQIKKLQAQLAAATAPKPVKPGDVLDVDPKSIAVDPGRFQYKILGQHTTSGSVGSLTGVKKWDPNLAGVIQVWRDPADGKDYVVNGHNRLDLAGKLGADKVTVRYLAAKDATEARAIGALTNIAEGRGTALDAAKFFRDTGISKDDLDRKGIPMREKVATDGVALSKLDDGLFRKVIDGDIPVERGAIIGGSDLAHDQQRSLVQLLDKKKSVSNEVLSELIDGVRSSQSSSATQFDLFGASTTTVNNAIERASLQAAIKKKLAREKKLFGTVGKSTAAQQLATAGNTINVQQSKAVSQQAGQALNVFDKLKNQRGGISDLLNTAATDVQSGGDRKKIEKQLYADIFAAIQSGNFQEDEDHAGN